MRIRVVWVVVFLIFVGSGIALAQGDRGTITGTVEDSAKAVVGGASIEAKNSESGATYTAATTETGNYTLAQLPAGTYELTVTLPGFKKYIRQNIVVAATQTLRLDVELEVERLPSPLLSARMFHCSRRRAVKSAIQSRPLGWST